MCRRRYAAGRSVKVEDSNGSTDIERRDTPPRCRLPGLYSVIPRRRSKSHGVTCLTQPGYRRDEWVWSLSVAIHRHVTNSKIFMSYSTPVLCPGIACELACACDRDLMQALTCAHCRHEA